MLEGLFFRYEVDMMIQKQRLPRHSQKNHLSAPGRLLEIRNGVYHGFIILLIYRYTLTKTLSAFEGG